MRKGNEKAKKLIEKYRNLKKRMEDGDSFREFLEIAEASRNFLRNVTCYEEDPKSDTANFSDYIPEETFVQDIVDAFEMAEHKAKTFEEKLELAASVYENIDAEWASNLFGDCLKKSKSDDDFAKIGDYLSKCVNRLTSLSLEICMNDEKLDDLIDDMLENPEKYADWHVKNRAKLKKALKNIIDNIPKLPVMD
jgi:hypothetical protein